MYLNKLPIKYYISILVGRGLGGNAYFAYLGVHKLRGPQAQCASPAPQLGACAKRRQTWF